MTETGGGRHILDGHVLIVDDEGFQLTLLARIMDGLGIQHVVSARNGREALEMVRPDNPPALIVTDLQMPEIDGVEMLRQMGERGIAASVILVSAYDPHVLRAAETVSRTFALNILGTIEKPVSRKALEPLLEKLRGIAASARTDPSQGTMARMDRGTILDHVAAGDVVAVFQPKLDLRTGRITGVEALARLQGVDGELIQPGAFVPVVESDAEVALTFTRAVARAALRPFKLWAAQGAPEKISINLPAACLGEPGVYDRLTETVTEAGVAPDKVVWEVTESAAIENFATALQVLTRLRLAGFGLAIDDYGTGHSSLERLATIPFSEAKIDRAFVRGCAESPAKRKILASAIDLVRDLGMDCVVEGAEKPEELELLRDLGCDVVQGYVVSAPLTAEAFTLWLEGRPAP
ncbi:MAG: EAL domain-containing response regulator [Alphaproteobacteria bacterium]|nr:EAL domain-containing response regulator [Alphaproteobacteria bacterium]